MFEDRPERFAPWKLFLTGSLLIALVAASVATFTAFANRKDVTKVIAENAYDDGVSDYLQAPTGGPQTILLIGSDRRKEYKKWGVKPLSDTMMLVRLDPNLDVIPVLSIPRDLKVEIPGYGTDKINASYSLGGPKLTIKTITEATGIKINHVVNTDFRGFIQAVDQIGCVYTDVDRRYFNDNTGAFVRDAYASINIRAGYQKLCGPKALDYVRFRHLDSDIVRGARQQSFLRQAKQQVGIDKLFANAKSLKKILASNTRTDRGLAVGKNLQRLLSLGVKVAGQPVYQVQIPKLSYDNVPGGASYVIASDSSLHKAADILENGPRIKPKSDSGGSSGTKSRKRSSGSSGSLPGGLVFAKDEGKAQAVRAGFGIKLPVYYPTVKLAGASYKDTHTRSYRMTTEDGHRVSAWRIVVATPSIRGYSEYYGIQGMRWKTPPILKSPSEERKIGRRTYKLFYEGNKLGTVAFVEDGAAYYVQNTLTRMLTEKQMLGIAKSLRKRR